MLRFEYRVLSMATLLTPELFFNDYLRKAWLDLPLYWLKTNTGAGEMAQRLRTRVVLPEVISSVLRNHMVAHSHL